VKGLGYRATRCALSLLLVALFALIPWRSHLYSLWRLAEVIAGQRNLRCRLSMGMGNRIGHEQAGSLDAPPLPDRQLSGLHALASGQQQRDLGPVTDRGLSPRQAPLMSITHSVCSQR
jgi:hypothetical protein